MQGLQGVPRDAGNVPTPFGVVHFHTARLSRTKTSAQHHVSGRHRGGELHPPLMSGRYCNTAGDLHGWEVHHSSLLHHGRAGGQRADHTQQDDWVIAPSAAFGSWVLLTLNSVLPPRGALGYCFVEMTDEATAERCLRKINGKSLPGASPVGLCSFAPLNVAPSEVYSCCFVQPTRFKLNRATFGKQDVGWVQMLTRGQTSQLFPYSPPPLPVLDKCTLCLWETWLQKWMMGCFTSSFTTATPRAVEGRWCWTAWATPSGY